MIFIFVSVWLICFNMVLLLQRTWLCSPMDITPTPGHWVPSYGVHTSTIIMKKENLSFFQMFF